jgi:hypothetical protein
MVPGVDLQVARAEDFAKPAFRLYAHGVPARGLPFCLQMGNMVSISNVLDKLATKSNV